MNPRLIDAGALIVGFSNLAAECSEWRPNSTDHLQRQRMVLLLKESFEAYNTQLRVSNIICLQAHMVRRRLTQVATKLLELMA